METRPPPARAEVAPGFFKAYRRIFVWTFLASFLVIFGAVYRYGSTLTPEYLSTATVQMAHPTVEATVPVGSTSDFDSEELIMESDELAQLVADRMTSDEKAKFLAPLVQNATAIQPADIMRLLSNRRTVETEHETYSINVSMEHPDPAMAARLANLFAETFITDNVELHNPKGIKSADQSTAQPAIPQYRISNPAQINNDPYEPKTILIVFDAIIAGLNAAAGMTCLVAIIAHSRWRTRKRAN